MDASRLSRTSPVFLTHEHTSDVDPACSNPRTRNHMDVSIRRSVMHRCLFSLQRLTLCVQTTKWLHRQFRWIIPFGRACLIPNLRYVKFHTLSGGPELSVAKLYLRSGSIIARRAFGSQHCPQDAARVVVKSGTSSSILWSVSVLTTCEGILLRLAG